MSEAKGGVVLYDKQAGAYVGFTEREVLALVRASRDVLAQVSPRARAFPTSGKHYIKQPALRKLARAAKVRW